MISAHFTDFLQDRLTRETTQPEFSELPFRFAEIAKVLLDVYVNRPSGGRSPDTDSRASDDITNPEKVRSLLQDIREARQAKSREGVSKLDHNELSVSVLLHAYTHMGTHFDDYRAASEPLRHGNQRDPTILCVLCGCSYRSSL